jgi:phosphatidylserine decarboxylase
VAGVSIFVASFRVVAKSLTPNSSCHKIRAPRKSAKLMDSLSLTDRAARAIWRILPKGALSGAIGWGASRHLPARFRVGLLSHFARNYGIDMAEAEKPLAEYRGFDEFFTRRLRPGARPIDAQPDSVISPADGTVVDCGTVSAGRLIQAKGVFFELSELLADEAAAARLEGGAYLITYLSPRDYHRVHSPVDGRVVGWIHVPGSLFSVNGKSVLREPGLFTRNERFITLIEGPCGLAAVVMVAAVGVGHVTASYDAEVATHDARFVRASVRRRTYDAPRAIARGEELGVFHLGSTTIVVFEPGKVALSPHAPGSATRMGASVGRVL